MSEPEPGPRGATTCTAPRSAGGYTCTLYESIGELDQAQWLAACDLAANPTLDPRFLKAVELSLAGYARFWYAIMHDASGTPAACACYCRYTVDGALFAPPRVQAWVRSIRKLIPSFFMLPILLCGVPISTGQKQGQLAIAPTADLEQLVPLLDDIARKLAKSTRCPLIAFKEFDAETAAALAGLTRRGYRRADSVVSYTLKADFASFDDFYEQRSKRTRANMRKVFSKFSEAGLTSRTLKGGEGVAELFTDEVHQLYQAVFDRAQVKFEWVPAAFFRELARQLPEESRFTFIERGSQVVGFCCALNSTVYHNMLYCGVDYDLNAEGDVYFNVIYRGVEHGLNQHPQYVKIGASADEFKQRMGCDSLQLYYYVRPLGLVTTLIFKAIARYLF